MIPELREFVLSLPLGVRQELCRVESAAWWHFYGQLGIGLCMESDPLDVESDTVSVAGSPYRHAYLPCNPFEIARHAAKLAGAIGHTVEAFAFRTAASVRYRAVDVKPGDKLTTGTYVDDDETGHRAAIALLQKVMAEKVTP